MLVVHTAVSVVATVLLCYISATILYNYILAAAFFFIREPRKRHVPSRKAFCILIPAHNEEVLIGSLLDSIHAVDYPLEKYMGIVVADNCTDRTAAIARSKGFQCMERKDDRLRGKGYAIRWALEQIDPDSYDAVLIVDADSVVDRQVLGELNASLHRGSRVIQCDNALGNPDVSWLTRIFNVVRVIDNSLVHHAKYKLGLSSFLMGNGMCLTRDILERFPWNAYSLSEDFEYYSKLILNDVFIDFNHRAKVFHAESSSLRQAYSQRSRWAAGKFELIRKYAFPMFMHGVRNRSMRGVEASFILILPHTSMLCNLTVLGFALACFARGIFLAWSIVLMVLQAFYFVLGLIVAKANLKTMLSFLYAPLYLVWKGMIDIISLTGMGSREWRRTSRT